MTLPDPAKRTLRPYREAQRQDSLDEQMRDVIEQAEMIGCYDAADAIKRWWTLRRRSTEQSRQLAADFLRSIPTQEREVSDGS